MWRNLLELAITLGALYLGASFAIPAALLAASLHSWRDTETRPLGIALACCAAVAAVTLLPPYFNAVSECRDLAQTRKTEQWINDVLDRDEVSSADISYIMNKCDDLPFV